jgi:hypothetical protein
MTSRDAATDLSLLAAVGRARIIKVNIGTRLNVAMTGRHVARGRSLF